MEKNKVQATDLGTLHICSIWQLYYCGKISGSYSTWKAVLNDHKV